MMHYKIDTLEAMITGHDDSPIRDINIYGTATSENLLEFFNKLAAEGFSKEVRNLTLCKLGLETLAEGLFDFSFLKTVSCLNLTGNKIRVLPDDIFKNFVDLRELILSDNIINNISGIVLNKNRMLRKLSLNHNAFRHFTTDLSKIHGLRFLDLSFNYLTEDTISAKFSSIIEEVHLVGNAFQWAGKTKLSAEDTYPHCKFQELQGETKIVAWNYEDRCLPCQWHHVKLYYANKPECYAYEYMVDPDIFFHVPELSVTCDNLYIGADFDLGINGEYLISPDLGFDFPDYMKVENRRSAETIFRRIMKFHADNKDMLDTAINKKNAWDVEFKPEHIKAFEEAREILRQKRVPMLYTLDKFIKNSSSIREILDEKNMLDMILKDGYFNPQKKKIAYDNPEVLDVIFEEEYAERQRTIKYDTQ